jgi:uncharacterized protein (DUF4415 family)
MTSRSKRQLPPSDYDPMPELTDEEIKQMRPASELFAEWGIPMPTPRGRPKAEQPKQPVTMRLDAEVLTRYKATGPGWQTRMGEVLAKAAPEKKST